MHGRDSYPLDRTSFPWRCHCYSRAKELIGFVTAADVHRRETCLKQDAGRQDAEQPPAELPAMRRQGLSGAHSTPRRRHLTLNLGDSLTGESQSQYTPFRLRLNLNINELVTPHRP